MRPRKRNSTSNSETFKFVSNIAGAVAADFTAYYRGARGTEQSISLGDLVAINSSWGSGKLKVGTNNTVRLDVPDAAYQLSDITVDVVLKHTSSGESQDLELQLVAVDDQDGNAFGLANMPTGPLSVTAGRGKANVEQLMSTTLTFTAGNNPADRFSQFLNETAANHKLTVASAIQTGDSYAKVNDGTIGLANLKALIDAVKAVADAVKLKTDNIPASPAAVGSPMTLTVAYDAAKTAAQASDIPTANIAAIKTKTDNLPTDPADASDIATAFSLVNSTLATIAGYIDTEVAAIKAKTDAMPADTAAQFTAILSDLSSLASTLDTVATDANAAAVQSAGANTGIGVVDGKVDAVKERTDNLPDNPADVSDVGGGGGGSAPTAEENALAVRAELAIELANMDDPVSTAVTQATSAAASAASASSGVATLLSKLTGITVLRNWLRLFLRKDIGAQDATALSEIAGSYDNTTDSLEGIRDRGDTAWVTGSGGGGGGDDLTADEVAAETARRIIPALVRARGLQNNA